MTAALSAAAVLSALAMSMPSTWRRAVLDTASTSPAAGDTSAAPARAAARSRVRCDSCGVVDAIRYVEPAAGQAGSWEFTVRMRDGSLRTSSAADASRWQAGDHIMLIGSAPALSP